MATTLTPQRRHSLRAPGPAGQAAWVAVAVLLALGNLMVGFIVAVVLAVVLKVPRDIRVILGLFAVAALVAAIVFTPAPLFRLF